MSGRVARDENQRAESVGVQRVCRCCSWTKKAANWRLELGGEEMNLKLLRYSMGDIARRVCDGRHIMGLALVMDFTNPDMYPQNAAMLLGVAESTE